MHALKHPAFLKALPVLTIDARLLYMWIFYVAAPVLLILLLWLFLIAAGSSRGMEKYKCIKYAHRGLHGTVGKEPYAAENSMTAFERAAELGFGIELDVQVSRDGEVVVFHDETLRRVTGVCGKVRDFTLAELKACRLCQTDDTIPTLSEVLELVDGRVPILVELKETGFDHTISEKTAQILKSYKGDFIVESFSPLAFSAIRRALPDTPCGFLSDKLTENEDYRSLKYRIIQRFLLNFKARPAFIAMNLNRASMFPLPIIKRLFGTPTLAWTVRSAEEEAQAYKDGFSGIIFENYIPDNINGEPHQ